jgi:hypothetical protein
METADGRRQTIGLKERRMRKGLTSNRSFVPVVATGIAVFSLLALLLVNHGPWSRPVVKGPEVVPYSDTAAAAKAAGAKVTPTDPKPAIDPAPPGPKPVQPAAPN